MFRAARLRTPTSRIFRNPTSTSNPTASAKAAQARFASASSSTPLSSGLGGRGGGLGSGFQDPKPSRTAYPAAASTQPNSAVGAPQSTIYDSLLASIVGGVGLDGEEGGEDEGMEGG
ncbi:hypothetical protein HK097_000310 [Rhizophlyctis rosea]|uniref:Uncharacterized protein n=1 Tax=Rhizophlyctis rosea TaxID=64517 RepID=A0AAD5X2N8_9FUNG|nr:hypothetical protein HK097_000310 [Rhizophlyctis rosea]